MHAIGTLGLTSSVQTQRTYVCVIINMPCHYNVNITPLWDEPRGKEFQTGVRAKQKIIFIILLEEEHMTHLRGQYRSVYIQLDRSC